MSREAKISFSHSNQEYMKGIFFFPFFLWEKIAYYSFIHLGNELGGASEKRKAENTLN